MQPHRRAALGTLIVLLAATGRADDAPFAVREIATPGRVVQGDIADLDGDGRGDLLYTTVEGLPPHERRTLHVHYQTLDGSLPETPNWTGPLRDGVAAYDLAELDAEPGSELVLLHRDGVTLLSLTRPAPRVQELAVPAPPTLAAVADERGIDRLRMARSGLGPQLRLLVPGLGETSVLTAEGTVLGRLRSGARANYFVPPRPGPVMAENEIELYFDHPRLDVGDVDGDGRGDVIASNRHELRVFRQRESGAFPQTPDQVAAIGRITQADHMRSSGSVRIEPADIDLDGRVDLLLASSSGSVLGANTELAIHLNRGGSWDLGRPDQTFHIPKGLTSHQLLDLDGDGSLELLTVRIPTGVLEVVEALVTRALDADVAIHRIGGERLFEEKAWHTRKLGLGLSFETFRPKGFIPTLSIDLNGDSHLDFVSSGDGAAIEVYLGSREAGYTKRHAEQKLDTGGRIRFGDLDSNGLADFLIYDARRPGTPIRIGFNRGRLQGTPPSMRAREPLNGSDDAPTPPARDPDNPS